MVGKTVSKSNLGPNGRFYAISADDEVTGKPFSVRELDLRREGGVDADYAGRETDSYPS